MTDIWANRNKSRRKRADRDFYETPQTLASISIKYFIENINDIKGYLNFLDAGCGNAVWGKAVEEEYNVARELYKLYGIDLLPGDICNVVYDHVLQGNFLTERLLGFNVILGNPPYSLSEEFVRRALDIVDHGGYVIFLLRLAFLESISRGRGLFKEFPPKMVLVCDRRPSFFSTINNRKTTDVFGYAIFVWKKGSKERTTIDWLNWDYKKE